MDPWIQEAVYQQILNGEKPPLQAIDEVLQADHAASISYDAVGQALFPADGHVAHAERPSDMAEDHDLSTLAQGLEASMLDEEEDEQNLHVGTVTTADKESFFR